MTESSAVPLEAGQAVVLGAGPEHARRWYRTTVLHVEAEVVWLDGAPDRQPVVDVEPGEQVTCQTWRYMDAAYQVQARVTFTRPAPDPLVVLTVQAVERIQQREYVRVPLSTEVQALYLGPAGSDGPEAETGQLQARPLRLEVRDLSAGGLRGRSSIALALGDELLIDLPLPPLAGAQSLRGRSESTRSDSTRSKTARVNVTRAESGLAVPMHPRGRGATPRDLPEPLNLRARVVRLVETPVSEELACEIGVAFIDVSREAHERIIRFALDVQRDRRRRGML